MATTTIAKKTDIPRNKEKKQRVPMTAKEAALLALDYFKEMMSLTKANFPSLTIDEVEFDGKNWKITIGFEGLTLFSSISVTRNRLNRVIIIDAMNRKVLSMKLR